MKYQPSPLLSRACLSFAVLCGLFLGVAGSALAAEDVQIYRDAYGVPHIYGPSDEAVLFGHGYAQAEDHLALLLDQLYSFNGRAYLVNPNATNVFRDAFFTALGTQKISQNRYHEVPQDIQDGLSAFCAGINYYIHKHPDELPSWVIEREITPQMLLTYYQGFVLGSQLGLLLDKVPPGILPLSGELDGEQLSNQWALRPSRVSTGHTCVQMDPHLELGLPYLWYEAHLVSPTFNSAGATLFGVPYVLMGHNQHVAWSMTDNSANNADLVALPVDPSDPTRYLWDGDSLPFDFQATVIPTRNGELPLVYAKTVLGPVLNQINPIQTTVIDFSDTQTVYVARLTMLGQIQTMSQVQRMNRAKSVSEFRDALSMLQIEKWNFVFGDINGNIAYVHNSRHPDRVLDQNQSFMEPIDGRDPSKVWRDDEIVAFEQLLQMENPPGDFLSNCNNSPWMTNPHYGFDETTFPEHFIGLPNMNLRGTRALTFFDNNTVYTPQQLRDLSVDSVIHHADDVVRFMEANYDQHKNLAPASTQTKAEALLDVWGDWDRRCHRDSIGMAPWAVFYAQGFTSGKEWALWPFKYEADTILDKNSAVVLLNDLNMTYNQTMSYWRTLEKPWHECRGIFHGGKFYGSSGYTSDQTLRVKRGVFQPRTQRWHVTFGSSYTAFVELSRPPQMWSMKPFGQSRDQSSPHFADLTELYSRDEYKKMVYTVQEITDGNHTLTELEYPPTLLPRVGVEIRASFPSSTRKLGVELKVYNSGPAFPAVVYVAVEVGGVFYFYPTFAEAPVALAELELPTIDLDWFTLWEYTFADPLGVQVPLTWYAALLNGTNGSLVCALSSSSVTLN